MEIIAGILAITALIVFFVMSANIGKISRNLEDLIAKLGKDKSYACSHCGFRSKSDSDFCPICEQNTQGQTIESLRKDFEEKLKKQSEKPEFKL